MAPRSEASVRDRAIWFVRLATAGAAALALGLAWLFSNAALAYFSGRPAVQGPPKVPLQAAPVQKPRAVITTVVHHPAGTASGGSAPRPPSSGPVAAPAPPPPPACISTPSHPC